MLPAQATFHGNIARTGVYDSPGPRRLGGVKWTFKAGGPIVTSPVIAAGVVYIASLDGHLYAIDQESGREKWNFKSRMPIASSPAVAGGTLYFVSSAGSLAALDVATGTPKWVFAIEYERKFEAKNLHGLPSAAQTIPDAWDVFTSSPAVADGKVYFGSGDAHVYAIDAATGRRKWDYPTSKSWVIGTPAVRDGVVYVGTSDSSRFMALDAKSGRLRFNFKAGSYIFSSAALAGDMAYVGSHNGRLYAVDAKTGAPVWEFQTEASKNDPMKVLNPDGTLTEAIFAPVFGDFQDMYIAALRFVSIGAIMSSPAVDRGTVYVGSMDGNLYALR